MDDWWLDVAAKADCSAQWLHDRARDMAEGVNGGSWDRDYTEAQKRGWALTVTWVMAEYPDGIY